VKAPGQLKFVVRADDVWSLSVLEVLGGEMANNSSLGPLRVALVIVGLIFIFGVYPLTILWPSGWVWHTGGHSHYLQMILGIYATLGVFLLLAARNPLANLSLIWFTVWSSIVHGGIMAAQAAVYPEQRGHLLGDVPALAVIAIGLAVLTLRVGKSPA
jgi:hypothetical protein